MGLGLKVRHKVGTGGRGAWSTGVVVYGALVVRGNLSMQTSLGGLVTDVTAPLLGQTTCAIRGELFNP